MPGKFGRSGIDMSDILENDADRKININQVQNKISSIFIIPFDLESPPFHAALVIVFVF